MILIGNKTPKSITIGGKDVASIALNNETVWNKQALIESPLRVVNNVVGSAITVTLTRNGSPDDIDMEYSTDNVNWHTWTETNGVRSMSVAQNGNLYLRGNNPNGLNPTNSDSNYYSFTADKKYAMAGDIRSLISRYEIDAIPNSAFRRFFAGSTTLYNASYMKLPAKKPGRWAYLHLFSGCTGLVSAPHELPATNLVNENNSDGRCYGFMFKNCTSLTTMPRIKATDFGYQSCYEMFKNCTSLTQQWASDSPSVGTKEKITFNIASDNGQTYSFYAMFQGCSSLTDASGITATKTTNWQSYVCKDMFRDCSALTSAPSITFSSFEDGYSHCQGMFHGCTSLVSTPNIHLDAPTLYGLTYKNMYYDCTSLTTAPEIKATTLTDSGTNHENGSLAIMFQNCSSLTYIKVNFTDWNNGYYTNHWTHGLPSSGRFDCPSELAQTKNASGNTTSPHYIPYNWSINEEPPTPKLPNPTITYINQSGSKIIKITTPGISGVTYYYNIQKKYNIADYVYCYEINDPSIYSTQKTGTGSNSEIIISVENIVSAFGIKVFSSKSGYTNSDIVCYTR